LEWCPREARRADVAAGKSFSGIAKSAAGRVFSILRNPLAGGWIATYEDITDRQRAEERIVHHLDGHQIVADISIGVSLAPIDGCEPDQLLKNADMALYGAKGDGRGTYRFFESEMDAKMKARRELDMDLRNALANAEFELYYQPLVNLQSNEITAFEALVRWNHLVRGLISPAEFIPVAEETGLIVSLGE
jgi:predicted signal transduction protein with EAL and GGDEF domain